MYSINEPGSSSHLPSVSTIVNGNPVVVFDKSSLKILKADGCKVIGKVLHAGAVNNDFY